MIKIIDDWFESAGAEIVNALNTEYRNYTFDGVTWPNIGITKDEYSIRKASEILGLSLEVSFPAYYRFYTGEDVQPMNVHSDVNEGEYTVLVFLNMVNERNGLAFWEHHTGVSKATKENVHEFWADTNDESKWSAPTIVPAQYNRAVIFEADQFHSRWPVSGWGIGDDHARLVKVLFLKKKV